MIEGPSGLLAIAPTKSRPTYEPSRRRLSWPNGAVTQAFSAEDPDSLRGPQFDAAWSDEIAKWRYAEAAWSNLQFALRLGDRPRQVVSTTPRPTPLLKKLVASETTVVARAPTKANRANLADGFFSEIAAQYAGTRLGRQELDGELLEDHPGALWRLSDVDALRVDCAPALDRIVVGVDPPVTAHQKSDECGIIVCGMRREEGGAVGYVLADRSLQGVSPNKWAEQVISAYRSFEADRIVVEVNQVGDLVRSVIAQVDGSAPVRAVRAARSKYVRAEPVAALYEQRRVRHVGAFPKLEDQMIVFGAHEGGGKSPDRVDALVWALTDLMLSQPPGAPSIRRV